ncbi:hydrogenase nickel incorporation protein HypB [Clostridium botulinum]|uniref:Hydrogenase accessory protein HypB n=1 Tax=Clostridium botulinum (strain Langeland / NCTC 10281 / Type F) TaxID=441772 RepID=A7GFF9_CLOBL|nr:hydrogenase nickel incorporation protein HypB [Clostridium botulinum]ABS41070.1 hydrogenase accessory protein HypB [Clostridium botulinum F str. Langeland]ADF99923.1 hydrogenase accessory protein HypB [Clostridium botulinum F str. 230613]KKM42508.1 hydantoin utilization protein A [Clostridium botulinum]MBD5642453.1 hydrogenase nickel incorporation protein HypB [Clostridium botulinum]MBY6793006.1 hydrogenase nickel incorporation protein HypB [Clostridium botulinum]
MKTIEINESVYKKNKSIAYHLRDKLHEKNIKMINLLGSPGSGKTTLLEAIIKNINNREKLAVIEGDLYTDKDAKRIEKLGIKTVQLNTKGACHLEADAIVEAVNNLNINKEEFIIIDNIGNLVCTAEFDLGEDMRIAVMSVTEGNDKPLKYPLMFQTTNVIALNKIDILPYTNFDLEQFYKDAKCLNPKVKIFEVSATRGDGINKICNLIGG